MEIKNLMVYGADGTFRKGSVHIIGEQFAGASEDGVVVEGDGAYAIAGLIDLHFHGCMGQDLSDGSPEGLEAIGAYEVRNGITTICPATMTLDRDSLLRVMEVVAKYEERVDVATLSGVHLEGPFFSEAKKGAQNGAFLQKPNSELLEELQKTSGQAIRIVSLAPELAGSADFIARWKDRVKLSIAHTDCDYDCAKQALGLGMSHVTHLFNAMQPLNHRAPGVIGAVMEDESCTAELICDGVHIHEAVIKMAIKGLGQSRVVFISDSLRATGLADGAYLLGGQEIQVSQGRATLADGTLAGSTSNLMACLRHAVLSMGIPFEMVVPFVTENPAKVLGLFHCVGSIASGKVADLVLLNRQLEITAVYHRGSLVV